MIEGAVVFWLSITIPDQHRFMFQDTMESLDDCMAAVTLFLTRPTGNVTLKGGEISAGCVVKLPPSKEG